MSVECISAGSEIVLTKNSPSPYSTAATSLKASTYSNNQDLQHNSQPQSGCRTASDIIVNQSQRRSVLIGKHFRQQQMLVGQQQQRSCPHEQQQQQKSQQLQQTATIYIVQKSPDFHNVKRISSHDATSSQTISHTNGTTTNANINIIANPNFSTGIVVNDKINKNATHQTIILHDLPEQVPQSTTEGPVATSTPTLISSSASPSPTTLITEETKPSAILTFINGKENNIEFCERLEWSAAQSLVEMNAKDKKRRSSNVGRNNNTSCQNSRLSTSTTCRTTNNNSHTSLTPSNQKRNYNQQQYQHHQNTQLPITNLCSPSASSNKFGKYIVLTFFAKIIQNTHVHTHVHIWGSTIMH